MKKRINIPLIICTFSIILLSLYTSIKLYDKNKITEDSFRLHVVANSNSITDQIIKLKIADKIENYINTLINQPDITKQQIYTALSKNMDNILEISNNILKENNTDYSSIVKLGKINYEEKENIYTTMDSGSYDSIQILLGKAEGKNYWNLIFPNKDNIKNLEGLENVLPGISNLYDDEELQKKENVNKTYSFKFLEVMQDIFKN